MNEIDLLKLKQELGKKKSLVSELKGQLQHPKKQLEDDWNCTTTEQARERVNELNEEINEFDEKIEKGTQELEEKYQLC